MRKAKAMALCKVILLVSILPIMGATTSERLFSEVDLASNKTAEADTEAQSHFILPTDPDSRVRMPAHTTVITDSAPRRHRVHLAKGASHRRHRHIVKE